MDQGLTSEVPSNAHNLGGKAWTAYVKTVGIGMLGLCLIGLLGFFISIFIGLIVAAGWILYLAYRLFELLSYRLYYDDVGIWLGSGVLPWDKGIIGVKWRDLDEVVYFKSMSSWLFNSFSIRIGHRFTKSSEIFITHLQNGKAAVLELNAHHQELIRNNRIQ